MINFKDNEAIQNIILEKIEQNFCIEGIEIQWGMDWFDINLPTENTGIVFNDGFKLMVAFRDNKHYGIYCEDYLSRDEVSDMFEYTTDGFLFMERINELSRRLEDKVCKALWKVNVHGETI